MAEFTGKEQRLKVETESYHYSTLNSVCHFLHCHFILYNSILKPTFGKTIQLHQE